MTEKNIATRLACYGSDPQMRTRIAEEVPERAQAALSLRFLIEYVAARPPCGMRPFSLGVLDRLMALASQIVNFGFDCDLIHYGLANLKHAILPSGRFGTAREDHARRRARYMADFMGAQISASIRSFGRDGAERVEPGEMPPLVARLDAAAQEEFGLTITDSVEFLTVMVDLSGEAGAGVSRMPVAVLVEHCADTLNWSEEPDAVETARRLPQAAFPVRILRDIPLAL